MSETKHREERPADNDREAWKRLLPAGPLPDTGPKQFKVGQIWAYSEAHHGKWIFEVTWGDGGPACIGKKLASGNGDLIGNLFFSSHSTGCSAMLFDAPAPSTTATKSKPAEKPRAAERALRPGWVKIPNGANCYTCPRNVIVYRRDRSPTQKSWTETDFACEGCAEARGVFAAPPVVVVPPYHVEDIKTDWKLPAGWKRYEVATWDVRPGQWQTDPSDPAIERWVTYKPKPLAPCTRCAHPGHAGPCAAKFQFTGDTCPCGEVKAAKGTRVVGAYNSSFAVADEVTGGMMAIAGKRTGATATLLANLAREKPPERALKVKARYLPGANLDEP